MPIVSALLIASGAVPLVVSFKMSNDTAAEVSKAFLGANIGVATTACSFGSVLSANDADFPINPVSKAVVRQLSTENNNYEPRGRCLILGRLDDKGVLQNIDKTVIDGSFRLYQELTGKSINGRHPNKRLGPKRAKRDFDIFSKVFQRSIREELKQNNQPAVFADISKQTRAAWKELSEEDKKQYVDLAEADKQRYETELSEYRRKNPLRPKYPRNAYNLYCQAFPDKTKRQDWKTLAAEAKAPYEAQAKEDKARFDAEVVAFQEHCTESGKDFNFLMRRKPRKVSEDGSEESPKKPKKNAEAKTSDEEKAKPKAKPKAKATKKAKDSNEGEKPKRSRKPKVEKADGESVATPKKRSRKPKAEKAENVDMDVEVSE